MSMSDICMLDCSEIGCETSKCQRRKDYYKGRADAFEKIRDSMTFHHEGLSGYFIISFEEWEQLTEGRK